MHVVAVFNVKGGVGKTSTAVNLADVAAREGCRTLLWDLDAQGGASYLLRRRPLPKGVTRAFRKGDGLARLVQPTLYDRLSVLPATAANAKLDILLERMEAGRKLLRRLVTPLARKHDILILDCPPTLSLLAQQILRAAHLAVLPIMPAPLSVRAFELVEGLLSEHEISTRKLRPVFNLVDRRRALHRDWILRPPAQFKRRFDTVIPAASAVEQMGVHRAPLNAFAPRSPATVAYTRLWQEAFEWLGERPLTSKKRR